MSSSGTKSQDIRVLDVALFGPFMLWAAWRLDAPDAARIALAGLGIGTIILNWETYRARARAT